MGGALSRTASTDVVHRLQTRAQFQAVLAGTTAARTRHFALHRLMLEAAAMAPGVPDEASSGPRSLGSKALFVMVPGQSHSWVGAMVPKRWAKRAVTRNTIKRQIYALSRELPFPSPDAPPAAYLVRLRSTFDRQQFVSATSDALKAAVRAELRQLLASARPGRSA